MSTNEKQNLTMKTTPRMKNHVCRGLLGLWLASLAAGMLTACAKEFQVTVTNSLSIPRPDEMVEVPNPFPSATSLTVTDERGRRVPCQLTYDGDVIFLIDIGSHEMRHFTIAPGRSAADTLAYGAVYAERDDDLAWENNKVAFRAYGPALEARGEQAYGFDVFAKRGRSTLMLPELYRKALHAGQSYHEDHGRGLDCYAVGPTLGAGAPALQVADTLFYPRSYRTARILDNGPLRFTAELTYQPYTLDEDTSVVEIRRITLDAGSHLNRTIVFYKNLHEERPLITGLALHDADGAMAVDANGRYVAYADPTQSPGHGRLFMGIVASDSLRRAAPVYFPAEEQVRRGAYGHLQAEGVYRPGYDYVYYWGYGWSQADTPTLEAWEKYLQQYVQRIDEPLMVSYQIE
jgi:hypothetical protein